MSYTLMIALAFWCGVFLLFGENKPAHHDVAPSFLSALPKPAGAKACQLQGGSGGSWDYDALGAEIRLSRCWEAI